MTILELNCRRKLAIKSRYDFLMDSFQIKSFENDGNSALVEYLNVSLHNNFPFITSRCRCDSDNYYRVEIYSNSNKQYHVDFDLRLFDRIYVSIQKNLIMTFKIVNRQEIKVIKSEYIIK